MRPLTIPMFLCGMGSVLEIYPVPYLYQFHRHRPDLSDAQRLANDWRRVGEAMYSAMGSLSPEQAGEQAQQEKPAATGEPAHD